MDDLTVEEEYVTRLHGQGAQFHPVCQLDGGAAEELAPVRIDQTEFGQVLGVRHDLHAAVVLIVGVDGHPGRETGARPHFQRTLVLMQGLAAGAGRLEVEHGLRGQRLAAQQGRRQGAQAWIQQPVAAEAIVTVRVNHARIAEERIMLVGDAVVMEADLARVQAHEVRLDRLHFRQREQGGHDHVALLLKAFHILCVDHVLLLSNARCIASASG